MRSASSDIFLDQNWPNMCNASRACAVRVQSSDSTCPRYSIYSGYAYIDPTWAIYPVYTHFYPACAIHPVYTHIYPACAIHPVYTHIYPACAMHPVYAHIDPTWAIHPVYIPTFTQPVQSIQFCHNDEVFSTSYPGCFAYFLSERNSSG